MTSLYASLNRLRLWPVAAALTAMLAASMGAVAQDVREVQADRAEQLRFFESRIRPVLIKHCYECHSAESKSVKGGLRLDSAVGWKRGGDSGAAIASGLPGESLLIDALRFDGMEMPPSGRLPDKVVADFESWIAAGAIDPRDEEPGLSPSPPPVHPAAAAELWSFEPLAAVAIPAVKATAWPRTAIDHFVLARLEQAGLQPIEDADAGTLLRRLSFDLSGLPPAPARVQRLHRTKESLDLNLEIEKLLESKQFGEHWARHWLDVARYADSNGGDFNATFHDAWRYRNYVIDVFNNDQPFDQFIVEQIAGDLLPAADDQQRSKQLVATGFLMLGAKMLSERDKAKLQMDVVDEQISAVGTAFMGLTLGCARCHDHKFDPVSTQDYYALAGIFKSTDGLAGEIQKYVSDWIRPPLPISEEHRQALAEFKVRSDELKSLVTAAQKLVKKLEGQEAKEKKESAKAKAEKDSEEKDSTETDAAQKDSPELAEARERLTKLQADQKKLQEHAPPPAPVALAVVDAKAIGDCHICIRGEVDQVGDVVPRGLIGALQFDAPPQFSATSSGRLELARWLADPRHPLTARVIVNRIWKNLVGEGLVPSVDNFGQLGQRPTHPELLDYLAGEFIEHNWSTKWLVREIARSHVYQLASRSDATCEAIDPENALLWRGHRKRLSAEAIRDTFLAATGELSLESGQSPVAGLGTLVTQNNPNDSGYSQAGNSLRTIYQPIIRNELPALMRVFDFADPDMSTGGRAATTVPAQALWMLNGPMVQTQAAILARDVLESTDGQDARIESIFVRTLGRRPSYAELKLARQFIAPEDDKPAEPASPAESDETVQRWADLAHAVFAASSFRMID